MKLARVAVLGVAAGAGLLAAILAINMSRHPAAEAPEQVAQTSVDTIDVLVAADDITIGTTLSGDMVKWEEWPKSGASAKFITKDSDPEAVKNINGALARTTFYSGEPIVDAKLIRSDSGYMSAILPQGKRAVATRIAADTSAGGFILPNDRVDVIMTRQDSDAAQGVAGGYITETILNNVRVLAIDQTIEEKDGEKVVVGQTATLELTPQQAEILTVAQQMSDRLTLSLRSLADSEARPNDKELDAMHLIGGVKRNGAVTVVKGGVAREVGGFR
jgi:pilus assembly protein CpaB